MIESPPTRRWSTPTGSICAEATPTAIAASSADTPTCSTTNRVALASLLSAAIAPPTTRSTVNTAVEVGVTTIDTSPSSPPATRSPSPSGTTRPASKRSRRRSRSRSVRSCTTSSSTPGVSASRSTNDAEAGLPSTSTTARRIPDPPGMTLPTTTMIRNGSTTMKNMPVRSRVIRRSSLPTIAPNAVLPTAVLPPSALMSAPAGG